MMIPLEYDTTKLLETVGKLLGLQLGRKHYYSSILVPQAIEEFLERLSQHPVHGAEIRRLMDERRQRRRERSLRRASRPTLSAAIYDSKHVLTLVEFAEAGDEDSFKLLAGMLGVAPSEHDDLWRGTVRRARAGHGRTG